MKNRKYSNKVIQEAKTLYINEGLNAKEVCKKLGMTEKTLGAWIKEYKWKDAKYPQTDTSDFADVIIEVTKYLNKSNPKLYSKLKNIFLEAISIQS